MPVKNSSQQAILSIHRARQGFVKARTAQANQIRGPLAEFGIAIQQGISHVYTRVPEIIEDGENDLPGNFRQLIARLVEHLKVLDIQVEELEQQIRLWHKELLPTRTPALSGHFSHMNGTIRRAMGQWHEHGIPTARRAAGIPG